MADGPPGNGFSFANPQFKNFSYLMNVLVVGTGSIAKRHIKNLQELTEIEQIFIYSSRGLPLKNISGIKIIPQESLLNLKDVSFAIIANETNKHVSTAIILAEQGIHLFIEKPLSHKLKEGRNLSQLADEKKIKVFLGYNLRFLGAIQFLKKQIDKQRFGKIFFSKIEVGQALPDWRPDRDYKNVYSAHKNQGGGVALDLSHELDYMMYFFGFPSKWNFFSEKVSDLKIEADDFFEGIFLFKKDFFCNVHMDYLQRPKTRTIKIIGSEGTANCNLIEKTLVLHQTDPISGEVSKKEINDKALFDLDLTYKNELRSFIENLKQGTSPEISLNDGLRVLELLQSRNV